MLNTPSYRERYKEFLKIDFPRIPVPSNDEQFKKLVEIGRQLRNIHLMKDPDLEKQVFTPNGDGNWLVQKVFFSPSSNGKGSVYVSDDQYFADIPEESWNFYIGGYQPAQKWLKDRKGRELSHQDLIHYQKIISALQKTIVLQKNIDKIWVSQ